MFLKSTLPAFLLGSTCHSVEALKVAPDGVWRYNVVYIFLLSKQLDDAVGPFSPMPSCPQLVQDKFAESQVNLADTQVPDATAFAEDHTASAGVNAT